MLKVVVISIVLAVLGVLFILVNPHDPRMRAFGWFLIAVGSVVAVVFTYLWVRMQTAGTTPDGGGSERRRGS